MSVVGVWVFDELDTGSDIEFAFNGIETGGATFSSATTPGGVGKSVACDGVARVIFPIADQAGKTIFFKDFVYIPAAPDADRCLFAFQETNADDSSRQITVRLDANKNLVLYRQTTVLATGVQVLTTGFHEIDMELLVANASGVVKVYIDGSATADIDFSGDTQAQTTDSVRAFRFGYDGGSNGTANVMHWRPIIFNSDGTKDNGRVPSDITYAILHTIADTADIYTPSTGATAYNLIDELLGAASDADYVSSAILNDRNVCQLTALPADVGRVVALVHNSRVGKPEAGTVGVKFGITDGVSETQSAERLLPASFTNYVDVFEYLTGTTQYDTADTLYISTEITTAG